MLGPQHALLTLSLLHTSFPYLLRNHTGKQLLLLGGIKCRASLPYLAACQMNGPPFSASCSLFYSLLPTASQAYRCCFFDVVPVHLTGKPQYFISHTWSRKVGRSQGLPGRLLVGCRPCCQVMLHHTAIATAASGVRPDDHPGHPLRAGVQARGERRCCCDRKSSRSRRGGVSHSMKRGGR